MFQIKRRTLGSAFLFLLTSCGAPELSSVARSMLRRYTEASCIPMQSANPPAWDSVLQNVHLEASMAVGTVKISEAFTARKVFVHASPTDIRTLAGSVFIREDAPGAVVLYEYSLSPVRLQNRVEMRREDLPPVCKP